MAQFATTRGFDGRHSRRGHDLPLLRRCARSDVTTDRRTLWKSYWWQWFSSEFTQSSIGFDSLRCFLVRLVSVALRCILQGPEKAHGHRHHRTRPCKGRKSGAPIISIILRTESETECGGNWGARQIYVPSPRPALAVRTPTTRAPAAISRAPKRNRNRRIRDEKNGYRTSTLWSPGSIGFMVDWSVY